MGDVILFSHPLENLDQAPAIILSGGYRPGSGNKKKMDQVKLLFRLFPPKFFIVPGGYGKQPYGLTGYGGRFSL